MFLLKLSENTKKFKIDDEVKAVLDCIDSMQLNNIVAVAKLGTLESCIDEISVEVAGVIFTFCFTGFIQNGFSSLRTNLTGGDPCEEGYYKVSLSSALDIFTNYCAKVKKVETARDKLMQRNSRK